MNHAQNEIYLYAINDSGLYFGVIIPNCANLAKKKVQGKYNKTLAMKAFVNVVKEAIPRYKKEFGYIQSFSQKEKEEIAGRMLDYYSDHIDETVKTLKKAAKKSKKTKK